MTDEQPASPPYVLYLSVVDTFIYVKLALQSVPIAAGCDPSGLLANKVSAKVAELLKTDKVDVQLRVAEKK